MRVRWGGPLLGNPGRNGGGLVLAGCVVVVLALGLPLRGQAGPDSFDAAVDAPVIAFLGRDHGLLLWLAWPATAVPGIAVSAVTAIGCLVARRLSGVLLAVAAVPVAAALDDSVLKHLFHRTYLGQLAFPSGHVTSVSAQAAMLAILLLVAPHPRRTQAPRVALVAAFCVLTLVTAVAVIALRWHYFTDTVAGAAVGTGTVLALALLIDQASAVISNRARLPANRGALPEQVGSSRNRASEAALDD